MNNKKTKRTKYLAGLLIPAILFMFGCAADGDSDADGAVDSVDLFPQNPLESADSDGDCGESGVDYDPEDTNAGNGCGDNSDVENNATDITSAIFLETSADCADYANALTASVLDITRSLGFEASILISSASNSCTLASNNIPNHDFNDASAHFATNVSAVNRSFSIPRNPSLAATKTEISQRSWDAVMLNGVVVDLLSAGCYDPGSPMADQDGNVAIGCSANDAWLLDPLGTDSKFGADAHNAHTQPDGTYHYHGSPMAMFDDSPGGNGSPVIGFAADGFPIYGSYFLDASSGSVRKAVSGYTLKTGTRPSGASDPGGSYNGLYVDDYEFTGAGDLDECNGMTVAGQYGYYVTDSYPWILKCFSGTPDASFNK